MQKRATYDAVVETCEKLTNEGQKVTGRSVLAITGGSLGTVLGYIKRWKENFSKSSGNMPTEIPPELQSILLRSLGIAQDAAEEKLREEIKEMGSREAEALNGLISTETQVEKLETKLSGLQESSELEKYESEKINAVLQEKIDSLNKRVQNLETERSQLIESAELSRTETAKAQLQIERADMATVKAEAAAQQLVDDLREVTEHKIEAEKDLAVALQKVEDHEISLKEVRELLEEVKTGHKVVLEEQKQLLVSAKEEHVVALDEQKMILKDTINGYQKNIVELKQNIAVQKSENVELQQKLSDLSMKVIDFKAHNSHTEDHKA